MSSIITITVYTLDELSCPARGKARDWYRQHHADSNWYENVYEDFREVCGIFGIDLRQRVFRLSNGRFMEEPCIWFSGFCGQGDGACFEGRWHWQPAAPRKIRKKSLILSTVWTNPAAAPWAVQVWGLLL